MPDVPTCKELRRGVATLAKLTFRRARFVAEYLVDGNGTRAAIAAGYGVAGAPVAAFRLLRNDKVQNALQARQSADATPAINCAE